jgi:hypothetical protein
LNPLIGWSLLGVLYVLRLVTRGRRSLFNREISPGPLEQPLRRFTGLSWWQAIGVIAILAIVGYGSLLAAACSSSEPPHTQPGVNRDTSEIRSFTDEAQFQEAVGGRTAESFNQSPVGSIPRNTLQLGGVTVTLRLAGGINISGPGLLGFPTNFLSTGVQDGGNNVVITFPSATRGGGMKLASVFPVTLTATSASGKSSTVTFSASLVSFVGFVADSGLAQIRISSPSDPSHTPIVNIGDISYAAARVSCGMGPPRSPIRLATQ